MEYFPFCKENGEGKGSPQDGILAYRGLEGQHFRGGKPALAIRECK